MMKLLVSLMCMHPLQVTPGLQAAPSVRALSVCAHSLCARGVHLTGLNQTGVYVPVCYVRGITMGTMVKQNIHDGETGR